MRDRIKSVLDENCLANNRCKGEYQIAIDSSGLPCRCRVQCWQCHKNDYLADRIADLVPAEVKK